MVRPFGGTASYSRSDFETTNRLFEWGQPRNTRNTRKGFNHETREIRERDLTAKYTEYAEGI